MSSRVLGREKEMDAKKMGVAVAKIPIIKELTEQFRVHLGINGLTERTTSLALPVHIEAESQSDVLEPIRKESEDFCHGFRNGSRVQEVGGGTRR
jgi:hypothetical protein